MYANDIPSASIFKKGLQRAMEEIESNGRGLNSSLVNDFIVNKSIGYAVKTFFEGVEDLKMRFIMAYT